MTNAAKFWRRCKREGRDVLDALRDLEENGIQFGAVTVNPNSTSRPSGEVEAVQFEDGSLLLLHGPDLGSDDFPAPLSVAGQNQSAGVFETGPFKPIEGVQDEKGPLQDEAEGAARAYGKGHGLTAVEKMEEFWGDERVDWGWEEFRDAHRAFARGLFWAPSVAPSFGEAPDPVDAENAYWCGFLQAVGDAWNAL